MPGPEVTKQEAKDGHFLEEEGMPQTPYASLIMDQICMRGMWDVQLDMVISIFPEAAIWTENLVPSSAHRQLAGGVYRKSFLEESLRIVIHIKTQEVRAPRGLFEWFTGQDSQLRC